METFSLGVEEEYQILDPKTRGLRPGALRVLAGAEPALGKHVQLEFRLSQIETATPVCQTLAEVRAELARLRRRLLEAAARDGERIGAAGTHPFSPPQEQPFTPKERYWEMAARAWHFARELVIFGCHVHVGLQDPEAAVQVMNRARLWLSPLLALSANSPFWVGHDTGCASFRTELYSRSPMSGPPQPFTSRAEYEALLHALLTAGAIQDEASIRWDLRLPRHVPTIEFRTMDACLTIEEAVMLAGLARAVTRTCYEQAQRDEPYCAARPELLRAAHWRAAHDGLDGELIDVHTQRSVSAGELVEGLLRFVRPSLEALGEWEEVSSLTRRTLAVGTGASRQRAVYRRRGSLKAVVDFVIEQTAQGTGWEPDHE
jgi:carboxylate-amine ligase